MKHETHEKNLVLIVDDSPETLSILNEVLEQAEIETLVALEGHQALSIARRMLPDLILLDAVMPGMDGFDVCQKLKSDPELRSIPVIFMTGLSDTDNVVKGLHTGGVDYITKPIVNSELVARIRVHIANNRLALSAQSALDIAGHFIFAVDSQGQQCWSTPQVNQLLEQANNNTRWLTDQFSLILKEWMREKPAIGSIIPLNAPIKKLKLYFLGSSGGDEYLIRLINQEEMQKSDVFKDQWKLTNRESEVLYWIAKGKTNREIAQILGASPRTINKHAENIYKKMAVENRTTAAANALEYLNR